MRGLRGIPSGAFDRDHHELDNLETDHMHDGVPEETEGRDVLRSQLTGLVTLSLFAIAMGGTLMHFWTGENRKRVPDFAPAAAWAATGPATGAEVAARRN